MHQAARPVERGVGPPRSNASGATIRLCARMRSPNLLLTSNLDRSFLIHPSPIHPSGVTRLAFPQPIRSGLLGESPSRGKNLELLSVLGGASPPGLGRECAIANGRQN